MHHHQQQESFHTYVYDQLNLLNQGQQQLQFVLAEVVASLNQFNEKQKKKDNSSRKESENSDDICKQFKKDNVPTKEDLEEFMDVTIPEMLHNNIGKTYSFLHLKAVR